MSHLGLWQTIFTGLLWLSLPGICVIAQDDVNEQEAGSPQIEKAVSAKRFQLNKYFEVEIETLDRVCKLEPEQKSKLQVGTKGAIKKLAAEWEKKFKKIVPGRIGDDLKKRNGNESDETASIDIDDAREIDAEIVGLLITDEFPLKSNVESDVWKNLVSGILNPEQSKKWSDFKQSELQDRRKAYIQHLCLQFRSDLSLSEDQTTQMMEVLNRQFQKKDYGVVPMYELYFYYYLALKIPEEDLKPFLSPAQFQKFQLVVLPFKEIGQQIEGMIEADDDEKVEN